MIDTKKNFHIIAFLILVFIDVFLWFLVFSRPPVLAAELYYLDVGQGDSSLVFLPGGAKILIDGGPNGKVVDILETLLPPTDRFIDLVVMSHPQLDHFGGLIDVIKNYQVGAFIGSGRKVDGDGAYSDLRLALEERRVPYIALGEGDVIRFGQSYLEVLAPSLQELISAELNDSSVVLKLVAPEFSALFTGDIDMRVEDRLVDEYDLNVDILKVAHHGSKYSSSLKFLQEVSPAASVVSVGKNSYGHPADLILNRLKEVGSYVFRTDQNGILRIGSKEGKLEVFGGH